MSTSQQKGERNEKQMKQLNKSKVILWEAANEVIHEQCRLSAKAAAYLMSAQNCYGLLWGVVLHTCNPGITQKQRQKAPGCTDNLDYTERQTPYLKDKVTRVIITVNISRRAEDKHYSRLLL